jgi:hypothetical protein
MRRNQRIAVNTSYDFVFPDGEQGYLEMSIAAICTLSLRDVLIGVEDRGEEIAESPDALEHDLRRQVGGVKVTSIEFFPGEWGGDRGVSRSGTQRVGCCGVAANAVLRIINRDAASLVRRA